MTSTEELIELSKRVAEKLGIEPCTGPYAELYAEIGSEIVATGEYEMDDERTVWLHEDRARLFELMCEHGIDLMQGDSCVYGDGHIRALLSDYSNDRCLATRVAILRAIEGM